MTMEENHVQSRGSVLSSITDEYHKHAAWRASQALPPAARAPTESTTTTTKMASTGDSHELLPSTLTAMYMMNQVVWLPCADHDGQSSVENTPLTIQIGSSQPDISNGDDDTTGGPKLTFPLCDACANPLQPGWNGTFLKKLTSASRSSLSKTQARRERRQRRVEKNKAKKNPALVKRVRPSGIKTKNALILECGVCSTESKFPGNIKERSAKEMKSNKNTNNHSKQLLKGNNKSKKGIKPREKAFPRKESAAVTALANFMELPSAPFPTPPTQKAPMTLSEAGKKKKKKVQRGSKLMDFLSSLNE